MTALRMIETTLPLISGSKISKENTYDTLLSYFNMAKTKLARDTNLWIGGESIAMVEGQKEYTLSLMPIQILEVYDDSLRVRPRNSFDLLGYTQISPNKIYVNNPVNGEIINLNWFEEPADYALEDEVVVPNDLIEAMQHYVASKVFEVYKSEEEEVKAQIHLQKYNQLIAEYKAKTDMPYLDSINPVDNITFKGLV